MVLLNRVGLAHVVPEKWVGEGTPFVFFQVSNRIDMSSRTGLEAEAINRLTNGVQPAVMRAILVQCLAGDIAPSAAISRMLAEGPSSTVRAAIDYVTERAATISRASDMLVHDRVDELTQVFVENVAAFADVSDATKISSAAKAAREARTARSLESGDRGEPRISE
jgi:hypothetical protein